jgi:hypothetical protein
MDYALWKCAFIQTFGWTSWTGNRPIARFLSSTGQHKRENRMHRAGFDLTILLFECTMTIYALDGVATGIGMYMYMIIYSKHSHL